MGGCATLNRRTSVSDSRLTPPLRYRGRAMSSKVHHRLSVRVTYFLLGLFSLGVGLVGVLVPLIPTTGPVLLAAFFFARSSERYYNWLLNNRRFGPAIRDYQAGLGIPLRSKIVAVATIVVTFSITMALVVTATLWRALLIVLALGIVTFIVTRPTKRATSHAVPAGKRAG